MISYNRCNFRCGFCGLARNNFNFDNYINYTDDQFIATIISLFKYGKNFKFTGGEPTLNPLLESHVKFVKNIGGSIFLDTNGSNPKTVKNLIDKNLIDVLGVSFKGLTQEDALKTTHIKKLRYCWENVFKTIEYASANSNVTVIVTYVCYNDITYDKLLRFSEILEPFPNVIYKINNLLHVKDICDLGFKRVNSDMLYNFLKRLVEEKPCWKNRVIYVDSEDAIAEHSNIKFL